MCLATMACVYTAGAVHVLFSVLVGNFNRFQILQSHSRPPFLCILCFIQQHWITWEQTKAVHFYTHTLLVRNYTHMVSNFHRYKFLRTRPKYKFQEFSRRSLSFSMTCTFQIHWLQKMKLLEFCPWRERWLSLLFVSALHAWIGKKDMLAQLDHVSMKWLVPRPFKEAITFTLGPVPPFILFIFAF